jgi:hypothetical protein
VALSDYVVAGYFLALPEKRHEGFNDPELIPPEVFSASSHASRLPNVEYLARSGASDADRLESAREYGFSPDRIPALVKWTTERADGETLGVDLCATRAGVVEVRAAIGPASPSLAEVGLALPRREVERFLGLWGATLFGEAAGLARDESPAPGGLVLGHEPLSCCGGPPSCSWICTASEKGVYAALGIRPNAHGLIDSLDDALRACAWIDEDTSHGEPGPWFPWLLIRYDVPADS